MPIKSAASVRVVLVTCATISEARRIADAALKARLAACATILPGPAESVYRWKGSIETVREHLILFKTTASKLKRLEATVKKLHSYDVPEFIALEVKAGSTAYLSWLRASLR